MGTLIGDRIGILLAERGIKQKELAKKIGVVDNIISYFVKGTRTPNLQQTIDIADFFNVSTDYLLGRTDVRSSDVTIKRICEITGLSEKAYEKLCNAKRASQAKWDITNSAYTCFLDMIEEDYYIRMCVFLSNAIDAMKRINGNRMETRRHIADHIKQQISKDSNYNGKQDSCLFTEFVDLESQSIENTQFELWKLETGIIAIVKEYMDICINGGFIDYADFIKECITNGKHNKEE